MTFNEPLALWWRTGSDRGRSHTPIFSFLQVTVPLHVMCDSLLRSPQSPHHSLLPSPPLTKKSICLPSIWCEKIQGCCSIGAWLWVWNPSNITPRQVFFPLVPSFHQLNKGVCFFHRLSHILLPLRHINTRSNDDCVIWVIVKFFSWFLTFIFIV